MNTLRFTFRLKPERDQALINWLNSLGEGERSFLIRQALRHAINNQIPISQIEKIPINYKPEPNIIVDNALIPEQSLDKPEIETKVDKFLKSFD